MSGSLNQQLVFRPLHETVMSAMNTAVNELQETRLAAAKLYQNDYHGLLQVLVEMKKRKLGLEHLTVSYQGWEFDDDLLTETPKKGEKNGHSAEPVPAKVG